MLRDTPSPSRAGNGSQRTDRVIAGDLPAGDLPPAKIPISNQPDGPSHAVAFRPHLSATQVDAALRRALADLQRAEQSVVLWFAEIDHRRLLRELGYASIHQYAAEALGFSPSQTSRFLRLATDLERLPRLRASLATGEIGWTKAREVVKGASPATEERWVEEAKRSGRRELERKVKSVRLRAAAQRKANPKQVELVASEAGRPTAGAPIAEPACSTAGTSPDAGAPPAAGTSPTAGTSPAALSPPTSGESLVDDAPVSVVLRLAPVQLAGYEALMECVRKARIVAPAVSREEVLLRALEQFVVSAGRRGAAGIADGDRDESGTAGAAARGNPAGESGDTGADRQATREWPWGQSATHYRIVLYKCASCGNAVVPTQFGPKAIAPDQLAAISCDATIERPGKRNAATIPPSVRRAVLARDHHRCRAPGCGSTSCLEVHHVRPRDQGGSNRSKNLVTLCSTCHRFWHARRFDGQALEKVLLASDAGGG